MEYISSYLRETVQILAELNLDDIDRVISRLVHLREEGGRLFILGVGGSAANASHAVNDFRKICGIESYAPTDNSAELTARINDDGWESCLADWLRASRLGPTDGILVFSVGGGGSKVSTCLSRAVEVASAVGSTVLGIVGRDGGVTKSLADACVTIPPLYPTRVTFHTEGLTAVLWHLLASHPSLQIASTKWESVDVAS